MGRKNKKAIMEAKNDRERRKGKAVIVIGIAIVILCLIAAISGVVHLVKNRDIAVEDIEEEGKLVQTPFIKLVEKLVNNLNVNEYYLFQESSVMQIDRTTISLAYDEENSNINIEAEFDLDEDDNINDELKEKKLNTLLDVAYKVVLQLYGDGDEKFLQYCLGEHVHEFRYAANKMVFGVAISDEQVNINKIHLTDVSFSDYDYEGINIGTGVKAGYVNNFGYVQINKVNDSTADSEVENRLEYALTEIDNRIVLQGDLWRVQVNPDKDKNSEEILQDTIRGVMATYGINAEGKTYSITNFETIRKDEKYMDKEVNIIRLDGDFTTDFNILGENTTGEDSEKYYIIVNNKGKE